MELTTVWFVLIAVLWIGYFVLEGFDFGVGMLLPVLAEDDTERRVLLNTIGPVWDGNEVWLLVAGGATFAAFPTGTPPVLRLLPGALLILVALILRGVAFEYRAKRDDAQLARPWDLAIVFGSFVPALLGAWRSGTSSAACRSTPTEYVTGSCHPAQPLRPARRRDDAPRSSSSTVRRSSPSRPTGRSSGRRADLARWARAQPCCGRVPGLEPARHGPPGPWPPWSRRSRWSGARPVGAAARAGPSRPPVRHRRRALPTVPALFPDVMPSTSRRLASPNASSTPYTLKIMSWVAVP